MIFGPDLAAKVLDGTKTQTRRPRGGLCVCRYEVGRDYAVQPGRGKKSVGRIKVLAVSAVNVHDISDADAAAEGFDSRAAFLERWQELYPTAPAFYELVWKIEFTLITNPNKEKTK